MSWKSAALCSIILKALSGSAVPTVDPRRFRKEQSIRTDSAAPFNPEPYPSKPRVVFRPDGTFKLTVFSDLHFGEGPEVDWGPQQDRNSVRLMKAVLEDEKPDYVVLNGDLITGENTFRENSTSLIDQIVAPLNEANVPFSSTHGNHDNNPNITHSEEIDREQQVAPRSYTRTAPPDVGGEGGPGNYWVPIYGKLDDAAPVLVLWFFDSRGGNSPGNNSHPVQDYVDPSVAVWIASQTDGMNAIWGPPQNRGALAFVHIPPHQIQVVQGTLDSTKNPGMNADKLGQGSTQDSATASKDDPFWDALNTHVQNLHAVISGHDHGNEWCAREPTKEVIFCFDKHSGYGGYSQPGWDHGVRNVLFSASDPMEAVETWIRLEGGETRARVMLDMYYGR